MKKLILIIAITIFFLPLLSFSKDKESLPDGMWYGNIQVRGSAVICNFTIKSIKVENNNVLVFGDHILGPIKHIFNLNKDKWSNKHFIINNMDFPYKLYYSVKTKSIKLKFFGTCNAEGTLNFKE